MLLEGIRIIDFTRLLPGPYATLRLADMGASIIKIEGPPHGDPARYMGLQIGGTGAVFLANNRNKTSIVLDLKDAQDLERARALIQAADVVIEGFRPGVADRLGIGYAKASVLNPEVIYCSLEGYDRQDPMSAMGGHDLNFMALSGVLSLMPDAQGHPVMPHIQWADLLGGIAACEAILAALVARGQTGRGQHIEVAMADVLSGLLTTHVLVEQATHSDQGLEELNGSRVCYHLYTTKDGRDVALAALERKFWANFCTAVDRPQWLGEQFAPAVAKNPVYEAMVGLFASRSWSAWRDFSQTVDCCLTPVMTVGEASTRFQQNAHSGVWDMDSPEAGTVRQAWTFAGGAKPDAGRIHTAPPPLRPKTE